MPLAADGGREAEKRAASILLHLRLSISSHLLQPHFRPSLVLGTGLLDVGCCSTLARWGGKLAVSVGMTRPDQNETRAPGVARSTARQGLKTVTRWAFGVVAEVFAPGRGR